MNNRFSRECKKQQLRILRITNQDLLEFHLVERRLQHEAKTLEHMLVQSRVK